MIVPTLEDHVDGCAARSRRPRWRRLTGARDGKWAGGSATAPSVSVFQFLSNLLRGLPRVALSASRARPTAGSCFTGRAEWAANQPPRNTAAVTEVPKRRRGATGTRHPRPCY